MKATTLSARLLPAILLLHVLQSADAQVISPFAGSDLVGEYRVDFARLYYLVPSGDDFDSAAVEGRLFSRIYKQPENKSNLEVFRSFESALRDADFDIVTLADNRSRVEILVRGINGTDRNAVDKRRYEAGGRVTGGMPKALAATQAQEYIAASKRIDDSELLVVVSTSRSGHYIIEELQSAAMEEGTVALTLDVLRDAMANEGRIAIYGLYFDTGSSVLNAESGDALDTIVAYLGEHPQRHFYVVGHTDDEGSFEHNMALSSARAKAVIQAIAERLPQAARQLSSHGVGPLSPVATNDDGDGRALNRRVELVSRIAD